MKRYICVLAAVYACTLLHAQKLLTDKPTDYGRYLATTNEICRSFTDRTVFAFGLNALQSERGTAYSLELQITELNEVRVKEDAPLLIKTRKGNVIELRCMNDTQISNFKVEDIGGTPMTSYYAAPNFPIKAEQLEQLISEGVAKIRVLTFDGVREKEFKNDKPTKVIANCYKLITNALSQSKDFYSDF